MCVGLRALVVALCALCLARAAVDKKYNITVGYLPSLWSNQQRGSQGLTISGAIAIALEEINNSTEVLPDVKILMQWNDTRSGTLDENEGLMKDMIRKGAVAFFGPEGRCFQEAYFANLRNLPMLSYKCADYETTSLALPNFVRMEPTGVQAMKSVISLLRYYRWNKFSIIYEDSWLTAARALDYHAINNNMTVNHLRLSYDGSKGWSEYWYQPIIQDTKTKTRIYVFLGSSVGLVNMMSAMDSQNLFANGEYMVIFVDMNAYMPRFSLKYLTEPLFDYHYLCPNFTEQFKRRARSLLVVTSAELPGHFEQFADQVRKYNQEEPFKFPDYFERVPGVKKFVSIYAAYLYDSVKLYATALDELIKEATQNEKLTHEKLMNVATDGSRVVARILKKSPFKSVSGMSVRLDENINSVGNFAVLSFKPTFKFSGDSGTSCSHTMIPVGHFQQNDKEFPEYKLNPRLPVDWADDVKPEDEPSCGLSNNKCHNNSVTLNLYHLLHYLKIPMYV